MAPGAIVNGAQPVDTTKPSLIGGLGFYFNGDDAIRVTSWNSLTNVVLTLAGRFLNPDGRIEPFIETHTPNTNRTAATSTYGRGCGWLTDLTIIVTGATPQRGQTFVRVDVVRGLASSQVVLGTLLQGYVTATKRAAYPESLMEDSLAGQGALRSITGTDPAANVEIAETVPTGARWRLRALSFQLVTDANVANREVSIQIDDGTNTLLTSPSGFNQAASLTRRYSAAALGAATAPATATDRQILLPDMLLGAGFRWSTVTTNRQATDNYGPPQYEVEEYLEAI